MIRINLEKDSFELSGSEQTLLEELAHIVNELWDAGISRESIKIAIEIGLMEGKQRAEIMNQILGGNIKKKPPFKLLKYKEKE